MASTNDFDPSKPALLLLYGTTGKTHRALDRDVLLIGRARGCDLGLDAPDVSSIHCLVQRGSAGFTVRDCQSRAGTKLNGNAVREGPLRDGDILQIGPFSFRVHLPKGSLLAAPAAGPRVRHLERSRRNLARIALRQRKVLRLNRTSAAEAAAKPAPDEQLAKKASALKARIQDYDQRVRLLEDAERDLSQDREALVQERASFQDFVKRAEQELAQRIKQAETDIQAKQRQTEDQRQLAVQESSKAAQHQTLKQEADAAAQRLKQREQELEAKRREVEALAQQAKKRDDELEAAARQLEERRRQLQQETQKHQQRQRDLDAQARQLECREGQLEGRLAPLEQERAALETQRQKLAQEQQTLADRLRDFEQQPKEVSMTRDQWAGDPSALVERLAQQKSVLAQVEESLHEQRQYLDDVLTQLQEAPPPPPAAPTENAELAELRQENEALKDALAQRISKATPLEEQMVQLRHENADLKHLVTAMERERERVEVAVVEARTEAAVGPPRQDQSDEVARLRQLVTEKEAEIRKMHRETEEALGHTDMVYVEAQLVEYRRQLETDRKKLNQEIEQVRARNQELDEATRELELEMSRDRADLARERQRLERLREDVRLELERIQRESGVRERLAPVQTLREEINGKRPPASDQTPKPGKDEPNSARLRGLRHRLNEA